MNNSYKQKPRVEVRHEVLDIYISTSKANNTL